MKRAFRKIIAIKEIITKQQKSFQYMKTPNKTDIEHTFVEQRSRLLISMFLYGLIKIKAIESKNQEKVQLIAFKTSLQTPNSNISKLFLDLFSKQKSTNGKRNTKTNKKGNISPKPHLQNSQVQHSNETFERIYIEFPIYLQEIRAIIYETKSG
ncbi:hypothetical protein TTHERM_000310107 (macronuclear) [Tetrahymena thermophila SB210]|uniref:Uncharacterized protein n=1 Tax=Tetrahymena thermophila (strain SB210) TaxID=312017 RepID=W7XIB1_TETTS|nr:hypothetical protein TTHERM_000310107 [Tetrahymena thermophila SB210]EWS73144.1 hypothetical protein TTHERM_000310107 [Tetrahymena thermophila SB210]|eukprot:XP_012654331.1 hypothetical protein TTHERM_000310107 [Tetrahymena thermophila SB210]